MFCTRLVLQLISLAGATLILIYAYFKIAFSYWKKRGIPDLNPKIPFGDLSNPLAIKDNISVAIERLYKQVKARGEKHFGLFLLTKPIYVPVDPEYVKNILLKESSVFIDRGVYYNEKDDPLSAHLFSLEGERWKRLRAKLTPTFTSGKMKMMFNIVVECAETMDESLKVLCDGEEPINAKYFLDCYTVDGIGSCAFGLNCNSFKNPDSDFVKYGNRIFNPTVLEAAKGFLTLALPKLAKLLRLVTTPADSAKFYMKVVEDTVRYREQNKVRRNDFMQILIDLKNSDEDSLTLTEIAAQAFIFFLGGFETSSTAMRFCLLELSLNQAIQQKVRDEVIDVLEEHDGKVTYEAISQMKYLGQVVDETLRKYPPFGILMRKCGQDYKIPETDSVLEKDTNIFIPVHAIHRDPEFYPNPEVFDPERFSDDGKKNRRPFTYLPFGEGPRNCIAYRFALMETKVGLAVLLRKYAFTLNQKTKLPVQFDPLSFVLSPAGGAWLNVKAVSK